MDILEDLRVCAPQELSADSQGRTIFWVIRAALSILAKLG